MSGKAFNALLIGACAVTFMGVYLIPGTPKPQVATDGAVGKLTARMKRNFDATTVHYSGCREVGAAGKAPIHRGEPGYRTDMDGDGDGIACEDY